MMVGAAVIAGMDRKDRRESQIDRRGQRKTGRG
jgi:hypothetical protein